MLASRQFTIFPSFPVRIGDSVYARNVDKNLQFLAQVTLALYLILFSLGSDPSLDKGTNILSHLKGVLPDHFATILQTELSSACDRGFDATQDIRRLIFLYCFIANLIDWSLCSMTSNATKFRSIAIPRCWNVLQKVVLFHVYACFE